MCDDDPVRVGTDTDVVDVAVLMSDYNLITVPVVDERRVMLGVITVDDVLEVTLPEDWRRREAAQPPDAHRGEHGRWISGPLIGRITRGEYQPTEYRARSRQLDTDAVPQASSVRLHARRCAGHHGLAITGWPSGSPGGRLPRTKGGEQWTTIVRAENGPSLPLPCLLRARAEAVTAPAPGYSSLTR